MLDEVVEDKQVLNPVKGKPFWAVILREEQQPEVRQYDDEHLLATELAKMAESSEPTRCYCFQGDRLPITKGPFRHLFVPSTDTYLPIYPAPAPSSEHDPSGYVTADPNYVDLAEAYKHLTETAEENLDEEELTEEP